MTRRDFELLARIVQSMPYTAEMRASIASDIAMGLEKEHPRFDYFRFVKACKRDSD